MMQRKAMDRSAPASPSCRSPHARTLIACVRLSSLSTFQSATSPEPTRPASPKCVKQFGQLPWLSKENKNGPDMSSFHENIPEPSTGRKVLKVTTAGQTYEEVQEEKRNSSKGALWRMASPSASREGSAHGGNLFGMKRDASFGDLWKWVSKPTASNAPSREGSQVRFCHAVSAPCCQLSSSRLLLPASVVEAFFPRSFRP